MAKIVQVKASIRKGKTVKAHTRIIDRLHAAGSGHEFEKLQRHKQLLKGHHPGDDSPFSEYDGYTVSDARYHITRKMESLKKSVMTPDEIKEHEQKKDKAAYKRYDSPAAKAKRKAKADKEKANKQKVKADPRLKVAKEIHVNDYIKSSMLPRWLGRQHSSNPKEIERLKENRRKENAKVDKLLKKGGFTSVSQAKQYYRENKIK